MQSPSVVGAPKVAIPNVLSYRDLRESHGENRGESQQATRVGRACLNCRKRKVKCSGDTPRCTNCIASNVECVYDQARRDRLKLATSKNKDLVQLLRDLSLRVDDSDKALIQNVLEAYEDDTASVVSVKSLKRKKLSTLEESETENDYVYPSTTARAPATLNSDEGLARANEDLLRSGKSRSTGWVGQGAEVHWLRSLQDQSYAEGTSEKGSQESRNAHVTLEHSSAGGGGAPSITEASFYLDADSAELDVDVDPYELPPIEIAERLLECYMQTVHKSFPILPAQFEDQFRSYFGAAKSGRWFSVSDKWLAIVNMVFAIGARYSHLISAEWQGEERDHLVYTTRTVRLLGSWPFAAAPDLALIQVSGLMALYYQVIGHVSRGWVMIGIAIRLALALGLHLRNEDPNIPLSKKETFLRTWWSLHAIECLLCAITGRPCVLSHEDATVPLPMTLSEEQSRPTSSADSNSPSREMERSPALVDSSTSERERRLQNPHSYLYAHLNIGLITQKGLAALYSPRTAHRSWEYVQNTIPALLQELEEWKQGALPDEDGLRIRMFTPLDGPREITLLHFHYYSTKMLITRPCLCRFGRKVQDQSHASAKFDQRMAETCVEAAMGLTELLPNNPKPQILYEKGPWWSIVHNIMQAMALLLLELSYGEKHMRGDHAKIKSSVKKLLQWLSVMRHKDAVVERAHKVIVNILQQPKFQVSFSELLLHQNPVQEKNQVFISGFAHAHPEPNVLAINKNNHQLPQSQWYSSHSPREQFSNANFNPAATDLELLAGLGHTQAQQQTLTQMSQAQAQSEQYQYAEDIFNNPFMFSHPFETSYDQDAPFGLTLDEPWSQGGPSGNGGLVEQHDIDYQNYTFLLGQNS